MKKTKVSKFYELPKKLKTLKEIKCPPNVKRKLRKAARDWIKVSKFEISEEKGKIGDYGSDMHRNYHQGQIDMLALFFNIHEKNGRKTPKH